MIMSSHEGRLVKCDPRTAKNSGLFCYVCRAENARSDARGGPAAARCSRTIDVKRQRFFVNPSSHRRNSDFGPSPLRACGTNTAEPHIRSPLLAAAPKFLIPEVIELYRAEPIFMAASFSQDIMRSARRVLARVGVPSREGWFLYVARRVRRPSSQLPLGFRLGSHSAKERSEAFGPAPLS
jgi:hypothetical protein